MSNMSHVTTLGELHFTHTPLLQTPQMNGFPLFGENQLEYFKKLLQETIEQPWQVVFMCCVYYYVCMYV